MITRISRGLALLIALFSFFPLMSNDYFAYLFAYFKGEGLAQGEQIYFAVSEDGMHWRDLNGGQPVLTSQLGEKGVRDPFIMRSADGRKFYIIATDLKIYGNNDWTAAQTNGSRSIMVWESDDLIHWSDQRMCLVAPNGAGCTWAPEAVYDEKNQQYIVFWSSKIPSSQNVPNNDNTHRVYYCTTKDFKMFSSPNVWIELKNKNGRAISVIDATVLREGDTYYRFTKNEATEPHRDGCPSTGKYIIMEKSTDLHNWVEISSNINQISYMEGPTCFKMNDENRWCLFLDDFGGKGYFPMMTENLSGGGFSESNKNDYSLPSVMRHGSVINITKEEYYALLNKFDDGYQTVFRVNPAERQQQVEGWGISLCWWANMCGKWSDDKVNDLVELLTSEDGLNYNIFRYNIGGGDAPSHYNGHMCSGKGKRAEMEGFKSSANSEYDWNADSGQRNILMKIKQKRPDAIFEAFSNSPPYWMTYSGCSAGNSDGNKDNLKPEYYGAFCDYLIDVCRHFKSAYNIEFKTLEPFNEPNTNYWSANGGQEGCHFDVASQINLLRVLSPKLKKSGLNTVISACDETSVTTAINELKSYGKESDIIPLLGQFNVHTYSGNPIDKVNLSDLVHEAKLPFWMSESGEGGSGLSGNLKMAQRMFDDVNYLMPSAWIDWQFMEEGNDQWCFVTGNFSQQKYSIVKNYYVRMQVTRFIKAGYSILTTGRDDVMAAISPDGEKVVVVMLNKEKHEKLVKVDLSLLKDYGETAELYVTNSRLNCSREQDLPIEGNQLVYEMGAEEISTILISMKGANPVASLLDNQPYLVLPRASSTVMTMMTEGPKLSYFCDSDTSQRWYFQHVSNDVYVIYTTKDERRYALTDDGSYYLKMNEMNIGDERQHFKIIRIAENCYKIISVTDDKWMDLEGAALVSGTKIGLWKNDEVGSNGHREWRILSFPFSMSDSDETVNDDVENGGVLIYYRDNRVTVVNALKSEIQIDIVDMNGRTVVNKRTNEERSEFTLSDGLYVVRCTGGKKTASKVLVW